MIVNEHDDMLFWIFAKMAKSVMRAAKTYARHQNDLMQLDLKPEEAEEFLLLLLSGTIVELDSYDLAGLFVKLREKNRAALN